MQEKLRELIAEVTPTVEFYLKREINSPSNHQEFAMEAQQQLDDWHELEAALSASEPAPQLGQNNEYAAYANHCAIEHKIPQTFHTWKREQIRLAKSNES